MSSFAHRFAVYARRCQSALTGYLLRALEFTGWGIRGKLIAIFVVIKVLPLLLLAWFAWTQSSHLGRMLANDTQQLANTADRSIADVGKLATADSMRALDVRMREEIERLTTDTAGRVANFLYERDNDIRQAASLEPDEQGYRDFIRSQARPLTVHGDWQLAADRKHWQNKADRKQAESAEIKSSLQENAREFHYRARDNKITRKNQALYLEITFVDLSGQEKIKASNSPRLRPGLRDISKRENTYAHAETYFAALKNLKPDEIYVSDVIGPYVGSKIIGSYTPEAAAKAGIPFAPEQAAFAGRENPVGQKFQGLIRWAKPVVRAGKIIGYVTLALDHDHLMEFTNSIMPTSQRYTEIPDASNGNYAFIWDYRGRNIAHPRHHSIVGYQPDTGEAAVPWLEAGLYDAWQKSGKPYREFIASIPTFHQQSLEKSPASELTRAGQVGLDCRYLNFAPQCTGWFDLTQKGGSGSFVIFWSDLWKLVTAAAIPYHTGQYASTPRGFGIVTIGVNIDEFNRPASDTKQRIDRMVDQADQALLKLETGAQQAIRDHLQNTAWGLTLSTLLMSALVVIIAILMASTLSRRIQHMIDGIARFRQGDYSFRFHSRKRDEMGALANSFDAMADNVEHSVARLSTEIEEHLATADALRSMHQHLERLVEQRTEQLSATNEQLLLEIAERRLAEERSRHLALHDPLTGLANRRQFHDQLQQILHRCQRKAEGNALLYFDLDHFKPVNDQFGHEVGDALLEYVAETLRQCVRQSDIVARLGGDEFAIILTNINSPDDSMRVAAKVIAAFREPIQLDEYNPQIGVSVGIRYFANASATPETLLREADAAMYLAKQAGGNRYQFYRAEPESALT